jgi:hypothetical protein
LKRIPATSGPSAGANLRVTFVDQMAAHDAAGKPTPPVRNLIFGIPVRKPGSESGGLMIFAGLSPAAGGPYGASMKATNAVERKVRHEPGGNSIVDESWEYKADNGASTTLQIQYVRGTAAREKGELRVYSQSKPEFFRIYRFEQGVDVVRGAGTGPERLQKVTFKAAGEKLSPLFDGTEQLISSPRCRGISAKSICPARNGPQSNLYCAQLLTTTTGAPPCNALAAPAGLLPTRAPLKLQAAH